MIRPQPRPRPTPSPHPAPTTTITFESPIRPITRGLLAFCAFFCCWCFPSPTTASTLYSVVTTTLPLDIQRIDTATGTVTPVGASGSSFLADLTSDWRSGSFRLWAPDIAAFSLLQIDPLTGTGTPVGTFHVSSGTPVPIASLAFNPVTATLYGTSAKSYGAALGDQLYVIDPQTAVATPVGALIGENDVFALAFDRNGTLWGISSVNHDLLRIDLQSGAGSVIASLPLQQVFDIAARPEDGTLFLTDSSTHTLYTLDPTTGTPTPVAPLTDSYNVVGLAFSPIPEPTTTTTLLTLPILLHRRPRNHARSV